MWLVGTEELRFKGYLLFMHVTQNSHRALGLLCRQRGHGPTERGTVREPAARSTETKSFCVHFVTAAPCRGDGSSFCMFHLKLHDHELGTSLRWEPLWLRVAGVQTIVRFYTF